MRFHLRHCILSFVKRLIRKKGTAMYLSGDWKWVPDYGSARDFETVESAIAAVIKDGSKDVELVLVNGKMPSDRFDIVVPLFPKHGAEMDSTGQSNKY